MSSTDKIVDSFPHKSLTAIVGIPTLESISVAHLELNTCAASVHSHRGNGKLGLLALTVQLDVLDTLSSVKFEPPTNPGPHPTIPNTSTASQITNIRRLHKEQFDEYLQYDQVDKALKSLLISAVDEACIRCLRHRHVGYAQVTTLQLITHLYDTYGRITPNALKENDQRLHQAYDPTMPFEILVDQVEDAVEFASAGKSLYTLKQIVTAAYNLIHETGAYESYCKDQRSLTALEQNWDHFKRFFSKRLIVTFASLKF